MCKRLRDVARRSSYGLTISSLVLLGLGCGDRFWDPPQIGRFEPTPVVNVILDSLGVAEETPLPWEAAEEPRPSDVMPSQGDYVLAPGDVVRVSILELYAENQVFTSEYVVSETGRISIPEVGLIEAAGLTEAELEAQIKKALSPAILKNPSVSVALVGSQQRTFSVIGDGVESPGRYVIPRSDFRLTDALALAKGPRQFNVSCVYVSRSTRPKQKASQASAKQDSINGQPAVASAGLASPAWSNPSVLKERAMLGMIPVSSQTDQVIASAVFKGPSEVISPVTFPRLGSAKKAEDLTAPKIDWIYQNGRWMPVARVQEEGQAGPSVQGPAGSPYQQPYTDYPSVASTGTAARAQPSGRIEWVFKDGRWVPVQADEPVQVQPRPQANQTSAEPFDISKLPPPESYPTVDSGIEWVFKDGKWVPIQRQAPPVTARPPTLGPSEQIIPLDKAPPELTWEEAVQTRLIRVPTDKLLAGDPRYNLVIQPGDTIHVPVDIVGECCIMGNVNKPGYINLTGRPMTLKMAIAAAGGLGPLAYPRRCEVVRRIGNKREEIVLVDLDKIARGQQPDFFIKPNDLINVGTHYSSRWRAVVRNSFRAVYGAGFVYDRNFVD
ncbi:MAG: polysaccharide biosynthesis/export family protein [Sedimentisphaerales bacterium]|nr:polysaccharide biosynthesis/export family protein [Sedimentisphaerales bacterium]